MPTSSRHRVRQLGATALVSAASTAALIGFNGTASAATSTEQRIDDVPSQVEQDSTVTFSGTLRGMRDQPLAGETVELHRNTGSGWSVADSEKTDSDGEVHLPAKITKTADWRLSYDGDTIHDPDSSETERVESIEPVDEKIVDAAAAQEGDPYSYGSAGPDSFDCSGLTQYAHEQAGIELPRTSSEQRDALDEVPQSDKKPGDLLFFADGGDVYHVGIYAGDNEIWHSPQDGETVHRKELWTDDYTVGRAW